MIERAVPYSNRPHLWPRADSIHLRTFGTANLAWSGPEIDAGFTVTMPGEMARIQSSGSRLAEEFPNVAELFIGKRFAFEPGAFRRGHGVCEMCFCFVGFAEETRVNSEPVVNETVAAGMPGKFFELVIGFLGATQLVKGIGKCQPDVGAIEALSFLHKQSSDFDDFEVMFESAVNAHGDLEDIGAHAGRGGNFVELKLRLQIVLAIKPFARRIENFLVARRERERSGKFEHGRLRLLRLRHARERLRK